MDDPLTPSAQLLIKLGSIIIHAQEYLEPGGHPFDKNTFDTLLKEPDVQEWIQEMDRLALLPKKRRV